MIQQSFVTYLNSIAFYHPNICPIMSSLNNQYTLHQLATTARSLSPRSRGSMARSNLQVRAQSYKGNEGRSSGNIVDENMCILSRRIEDIRIREMLERCIPVEKGWNYAPAYHEQKRAEEFVYNFLEFIGYLGGAFSLPIVGKGSKRKGIGRTIF